MVLRSRKLQPALKSLRISFVARNIGSEFGFGRHDGFTKPHTTIKLILISLSEIPNPNSTLLSGFSTEAAVTFSSNTSLNLTCWLVILLIVEILDNQKLSNTVCSQSKSQSPISSLLKGLYAIPTSPDTWWYDFFLISPQYSLDLRRVPIDSSVSQRSLLENHRIPLIFLKCSSSRDSFKSTLSGLL